MKINTVNLEVAEQVKATRAYLEEHSPPDCTIDGWLEASHDFRFEIIRGDELVHQVVFSYKFLYFHTVEGIRFELEDWHIAKRLREAGKGGSLYQLRSTVTQQNCLRVSGGVCSFPAWAQGARGQRRDGSLLGEVPPGPALTH